MKKLLIIFFLMSSASYSLMVDNIKVYGGINAIEPTNSIIYTEQGNSGISFDVKGEMIYFVGVEAHKKLGDILEIGVGIKKSTEFQEKNLEESEDTWFSTMPVYLSGKFIIGDEFKYYVQGMVGYSINTVGEEWKDYSVKAGMNYGLGFGVEIENFSVGIIYDVTKFNVTLYNDAVIDGSLKQLSLSVGLIFGE